MTKQASIAYISDLIENPGRITEVDLSSIAGFRQSFPYFVPARYLEAHHKHRTAPYAPAMMSAVTPYIGNWILFCDFLNSSVSHFSQGSKKDKKQGRNDDRPILKPQAVIEKKEPAKQQQPLPPLPVQQKEEVIAPAVTDEPPGTLSAAADMAQPAPGEAMPVSGMSTPEAPQAQAVQAADIPGANEEMPPANVLAATMPPAGAEEIVSLEDKVDAAGDTALTDRPVLADAVEEAIVPEAEISHAADELVVEIPAQPELHAEAAAAEVINTDAGGGKPGDAGTVVPVVDIMITEQVVSEEVAPIAGAGAAAADSEDDWFAEHLEPDFLPLVTNAPSVIEILPPQEPVVEDGFSVLADGVINEDTDVPLAKHPAEPVAQVTKPEAPVVNPVAADRGREPDAAFDAYVEELENRANNFWTQGEEMPAAAAPVQARKDMGAAGLAGQPAGTAKADEYQSYVPQKNERPLIYPVYTEDYFLQQGEKVSADLPDEIDSLRSPEEAKSLMVMMSFSEWLLHFKSSTEKQKEESKDQRALKTMWQKEKLAAAIEEENEEIPENVFEMAVNSITKEDGLASESLAEIYLKQGKYDKAIDMYRKLSLRNTQKSAYFARKIEEVLKEKES